jgi:hypothetical protein
VEGVLGVHDERGADLISELQEAGVDRVEAALQGDHKLDAARGAQRGEVPGLGQAGPKRFLLEHVDAVLGCGFDDRAADMVGDGDYHEVELLGGEHLAEVGVASDAVLVALLPEQVRFLVAYCGQGGAV